MPGTGSRPPVGNEISPTLQFPSATLLKSFKNSTTIPCAYAFFAFAGLTFLYPRNPIKDIFVSEVMRTEIPEINSQTKVSEAAKLMLENGLDHLPVLDNKNVIGVISRHDLLKVFTNI